MGSNSLRISPATRDSEAAGLWEGAPEPAIFAMALFRSALIGVTSFPKRCFREYSNKQQRRMLSVAFTAKQGHENSKGKKDTNAKVYPLLVCGAIFGTSAISRARAQEKKEDNDEDLFIDDAFDNTSPAPAPPSEPAKVVPMKVINLEQVRRCS